MPRRPYETRSFQPDKPVIVRKPFRGNGRLWQRGEVFDWQHLAVSRRRVRLLFENGKLRHDEPDEAPVPASAPPEPAPTQTDDDGDDLDAITSMKELRAIADREGAPYKVSMTQQRQAIRDVRG